jgi:hypothetical protein
VWARSEVCEDPETGARDQYMPLAGAGCTSGVVLGSGRGGKGMCGPLGARWAGVIFLGGAGEETSPAAEGLGAMADVERRFRGRRGSGGEEGATNVLELDEKSECSGLGV